MVRSLALAACIVLGCSRPASGTAATSPPAPEPPSATPAASAAPLDTLDSSLAIDAAVTDAAVADAARAASTSPAASAPAASSTPARPAAPHGAPGEVRVINIGMHIGGGPNDDVTKEPIHKSVSPHFDAIARCFPGSAAPPVDFGVDLVIEARGGKAEVARPRTPLRDDAFIGCVVGVFREIEFLPPRFGKTVVSYSLRFVPATKRAR